ncbi:MAG: response regulator, partial [Geitlerinemataceae cyanobacterium]
MKTVLVVEDDPLNWQIFQILLTRVGGFAAKHTEDVEEVMNLARSQAADVILMDVSLPNSYYEGKSVDGIEITQLLKSNPTTANIPVILVTANYGDREDFLQKSGADDYIPKPIVDRYAFVDRVKAA